MKPPQARSDTLLRTDLAEEVVIYDSGTKHAHSLNRLAVLVWTNCDGRNTIADLSRLASAELGLPIGEASIRSALRQLEAANLLASQLEAAATKTIGRRQMLQKAGQMGAIVVATPVVASILVPTAAAAASPPPGVHYDFIGTSNYSFVLPPGTQGPGPSPDTSYVTIVNAGTSAFVGSIGFVAHSCNNGDFSISFGAQTLNPGDTKSYSFCPEASNVGGFEPQTVCGGTDNGAQFFMTGTVTQGVQSIAVDLRIYDKDIHSGVPSTSPCDGTPTDAYVLQGGAPTGCDNGDGYETGPPPFGQAQPGKFEFKA
jgi:hypothetical protein